MAQAARLVASRTALPRLSPNQSAQLAQDWSTATSRSAAAKHSTGTADPPVVSDRRMRFLESIARRSRAPGPPPTTPTLSSDGEELALSEATHDSSIQMPRSVSACGVPAARAASSKEATKTAPKSTVAMSGETGSPAAASALDTPLDAPSCPKRRPSFPLSCVRVYALPFGPPRPCTVRRSSFSLDSTEDAVAVGPRSCAPGDSGSFRGTLGEALPGLPHAPRAAGLQTLEGVASSPPLSPGCLRRRRSGSPDGRAVPDVPAVVADPGDPADLGALGLEAPATGVTGAHRREPGGETAAFPGWGERSRACPETETFCRSSSTGEPRSPDCEDSSEDDSVATLISSSVFDTASTRYWSTATVWRRASSTTCARRDSTSATLAFNLWGVVN
jgi:hypothetical protein